MGRNNYFRFKQFTIIQELSAMKVGVDGVILGAWVNLTGIQTVLDVGTGTGLLAMMIAQRSKTSVTAIDIDEPSCREAEQNVNNSPWAGRIRVNHISYQEMARHDKLKFDAIVSNPPYFVNSSRPEDTRRSNARHDVNLSFPEFISCSHQLLLPGGTISVILPADTAGFFVNTAREQGFYLNRITRIRHFPDKPFHRYLMEFSQRNTPVAESILTIDSGSGFTEEYRDLTRDFYLAF